MQIYLIRHTETVCEKGVCYGQSNVELAPNFENQFKAIKKQLPKKALIYSSPLLRCTQLARYCYSNEIIKTDERLMEMNFGEWELKKWNDIRMDELNHWMNDFVHVTTPNGESFETLHHRVIHFWEQTCFKTTLPVILFTHAGVIRSLLCYIRKTPLEKAFENKIDFGEVIQIHI